MPELRKDPIVGRWVIIATDRAKRPITPKAEAQAASTGGFCPFCAGAEEKTPHEIASQGFEASTGTPSVDLA